MMQAILLAGGRSPDMDPLTVTKPKALGKVMNRTILEYNLDQVQDLVDEIVIVVGYKKEMIIDRVGKKYRQIPVTYIELSEPWSDIEALRQTETMIRDRFLLLSSDYLYDQNDLQGCLQYEACILTKPTEVEGEETSIKVEDGKLVEIVSHSQPQSSGAFPFSCYLLNRSFFNHLKNQSSMKPDDDSFIRAINRFVGEKDIFIIHSEKWTEIRYSWSLLEASEALQTKIRSRNDGIVEPHVTITGEAVIGKGTIIKNGAYIEGPVMIGENGIIGPNCYIRHSTTIGHHCKIGHAVEMKNTIVGDHVSVAHLSYLGDSIIGDHVNIGAGNISANVRHDNKSIITLVDGKRIDTEREKLGVIIGDHVHTGINTSFYPGRKIWPYLSTLPGEVIQKDRIR